jgi:phage-related baseplate assembly protein
VTVTVDPGLGWIVTQGVDEEPDDALRVRCGEQWSTLGAAGSSDAYAYNCKAASSEVTRVRVYEATPVPGWVTCYLAGPAGPVTGTVATAVRTWFEVNGRRPQCVGLIIDPAGTQTIDVTGTVNVKSGLMATAKAAIATAFEEIQAGTDFGGVVDQAEIIAAVRTARGVVHLDISTPAEDVTLAASQLAVLVDGLTYVEV